MSRSAAGPDAPGARRWTRSPSTAQLVLALLTAVFVLSGTAFALSVPMYGNPDEATHVDMVRHYAHHPTKLAGPSLRQTKGVRGSLVATGMIDVPAPSPTAAIPPARPDYGTFGSYGGDTPAPAHSCPSRTCQNYQFIHPPGWYLVAAPVAKVLDHRPFPETVAALRLLNVALGSVMVWATWFLALQLWPRRPRRALVAAGCTAVCGPLAAAVASVNNDGLMLPLMAVALALMAGILRRGVTTRSAAVLGVVIALGLLVKGQFVPLAAIGLAAVLLAPGPTRRERLRPVLTYLVIGGVGALWWLRVVLDTHGLTPEGGELLALPHPGPWNHITIFGYLTNRFGVIVNWFFGRYGSYPWPFALLPTWLLRTCQVGVVVLAVVWLVARRWRRPDVRSLRVALLVAVPFVLLASSLYQAWDAYRTNGVHNGLAPRYVYGAVPVMAVMATAVVVAVLRHVRNRRFVPLAHAVLLIGSAVLGTVVSLAVSLHGMYFTTNLRLLFQRAGVMAPVSHVKAWMALLAVLWVLSLLGAAWLVWRNHLDVDQEERWPAHLPGEPVAPRAAP